MLLMLPDSCLVIKMSAGSSPAHRLGWRWWNLVALGFCLDWNMLGLGQSAHTCSLELPSNLYA